MFVKNDQIRKSKNKIKIVFINPLDKIYLLCNNSYVTYVVYNSRRKMNFKYAAKNKNNDRYDFKNCFRHNKRYGF